MWRLVLVVLVVAAVLVWALGGGVNYVLNSRSTHASANATLISIVLAVIALYSVVIPMFRWSVKRSRAIDEVSIGDRVKTALKRLTDELKKEWEDEIEIRQLHYPDALTVYWRLSELPVMNDATNIFRPDQLASGEVSFSGQTDEEGIQVMAAWFRNLAKRRLVILGDAGTGKTTLAMLLMRELLEHPECEPLDPAEPKSVPVLLTLSDWHSASNLREWVRQRLGETYPFLRPFGPDVLDEIVDRGKILPVLDGLDELPPQLRPQLLEQVRAHNDPLILTCRTAQYLATVTGPEGRVLAGAAVIEPMPLQAADIAHYLQRMSPMRPGEWPDLLATLRSRPDHPITQALTTPLNVWLLRKTYIDTGGIGKNPAGLLDTARYRTQYDITNHLLDNLVRALFAATGNPRSADSDRPFRPRKPREPADASRWLAFLARHVQAQNGQDLAWWHLNHSLATCRQSFIARVVAKTGPGYGLVYGVGFVLFILLGDYVGGVHGPSLVRTLVNLLAAGVIGAILGLVGRKRKSTARGAGAVMDGITNLETVPSYVNFRSLSQGHVRGWISLGLGSLRVAFIPGLIIGFSGGVIGALFGAVLWWARSQVHWHASGLAASILLGSVMFFAGFFVGGFLSMSMSFLIHLAKTPLTDDQPQTPATALRRDLQLASVSFLAAGLPAVLLAAPMVAVLALTYGFRGAIVAGILLTCLPIVWGLFWAADAASVWYLVTIGILRLERQVPRRLMAFLDDAHRVGLLRQVGAMYQFRHITLTDYFAPPSPQKLIARHAAAFSQARRGRTRRSRGDLAAAIAVLEGLRADQLRVLGPDHPSTLVTWHEIARMMAERGDHAAALAEYRSVLAAELRVLGPDDPSTLVSSNVVNYLEAHGNP